MQSHLSKKGTPDHGRPDDHRRHLHLGAALGARLDNPYVWLVLFVLACGCHRLADDYPEGGAQEHRRSDRPLEVLLAIRRCAGVAVFLYATATHDGQTQLVVPFLKDVMPQLGLMFILLTYFVIVGTSTRST